MGSINTLAHLRADVEEIAGRGTVREMGPGDIVIRVPFWKIRAMRRNLAVRKLFSIRYTVRAISLREHWSLWTVTIFLMSNPKDPNEKNRSPA